MNNNYPSILTELAAAWVNYEDVGFALHDALMEYGCVGAAKHFVPDRSCYKCEPDMDILIRSQLCDIIRELHFHQITYCPQVYEMRKVFGIKS